jgi:adenosine/AMP kinase
MDNGAVNRKAVALQRQCDDWNNAYPIRQLVRVRKDDGSTIDTCTRSAAQVLSGHTAVIWVEGIAGCYLLDRVRPILGVSA